MTKLTEYENMILDYLQGKEFVSPTQIGRDLHPSRLHGSSWASPKCLHLVKLGLLKRNNKGWYATKIGLQGKSVVIFKDLGTGN